MFYYSAKGSVSQEASAEIKKKSRTQSEDLSPTFLNVSYAENLSINSDQ